jgi:hypothetical protein
MRCVVVQRGVPIGETELAPGDLAIGVFAPRPAYEAIRPTIRSASESVWAIGFFPGGTHGRVSAEALGNAARMHFDLVGEDGLAVAADWVNIVESPEPGAAPVVIARLRHLHAPVGARIVPSPAVDRSHNAPDE